MNGKRAKAIRKAIGLDFSRIQHDAEGNRIVSKPTRYGVKIGEKHGKDIIQWINPIMNAYRHVKRANTSKGASI